MKSAQKPLLTSLALGFLISMMLILRPQHASAASCYTTDSGDWNNTAIWVGCGGNYPGQTTNDYVTIKNGHTVTLNINPGSIYFLEIEGGGTFNSSSYTLSISANGGTPGITNNGTFDAGTGTITFDTSYGTTTSTVSGSVSFNHVTISGVSVNFGSSSTVNGTLTINSSGGVTSNAPTYGSASTLKYNTGGSYDRSLEWSATSGAGYPKHVQISNNTTLNLKGSSSAARSLAGNLTIDSGSTLTMNDMNIPDHLTIGGSVSIGGTFTLSTGTANIYVGGDWTKSSGGTFTNNGSYVYFNGGISQAMSGVMSGTHRFERIIVENSSTVTFNNNVGVESGLEVASGSTFQTNGSANFEQEVADSGSLDCDGTCTFNNLTIRNINASGSTGNIDVNGTLTINNASSNFTAPGSSGTFTIAGNFTNNITSGSFDANNGSIVLDGSSQQTIGGSGSTTFNNLTLSNSAGASLGNSQTVNGTLTLSSGRVTLNGYDFTFGASASLSGTPGASKMLETNGAGKACKVFSSTGSFTLPIGETTGTAEYSPAAFEITAGSGTACARVVDADHPNRTTGISDYITRYWVVSGSGSPTYDPTFTFLAADVVGSTGNMHGKKWNGSYPWQELSAATATTFSGAGLTSFSDFTAFKSGQLAVLLELFEAEAASNHVLVTWETVNERENLGFHLYRGPASEGPWTRLNDSLIPSQSPGSPWGYRYSFQDFAAAWGEPAFYRVDAVDFQGGSQPLGITGVALGGGVRLWLPLLAR